MNTSTKPSRCLGLIGGLGPGATVFYYRELVAALEKQQRVPRMMIAHANIHHIYAMVSAKDFDGLARYLAELSAQLAAGGLSNRECQRHVRLFF